MTDQISDKCVKHLTNLDVKFVINKEYQVIQSVFVHFLQKVCGQEVKSTTDTTMTDFSYLHPMNKPDHRHGSNLDQHPPANPDLDVYSPVCADRHTGVRVVTSAPHRRLGSGNMKRFVCANSARRLTGLVVWTRHTLGINS